MTKRIFRSVLTASLIALTLCLVIVTGILYEYLTDMQAKRLRTELSLASSAVVRDGDEYLSTLKTDEYRLTWVDDDGTVLYDTATDASLMENHADREEIRMALESGSGTSERYSSTLTEKTLYSAERLTDGTVLRISVTEATVLSLVFGMVQPILVIFVLLLILSAVLASRMSKRIVEPLNGIDLEHPLDNNVYEELSPLLRSINQLNGQVARQVNDLERKTDEFEQIIVSMNEGLVLFDNKGIILSINNAAMRIFGTSKKCIGSDFLTVDRAPALQQTIQRAMDEGHGEIETERDGREYQIDVSRIESDGRVIGAVLLTFDISEKAYAEQNRREFTANVSHELKTPLQAIMGSAELIENGLVKPDDMPRFVGHIRTEAARLVTLIEDIIRLSQLDEGKEMPHERVDMYKLAEDTVSELEYASNAKNISITLSGTGATVYGVKRLLSDIVFNLCDNAVKYTGEHGRVDIEVSSDSGQAILKVTDNGIGIPSESQGRVFERFYRVDKSHSKQSGGTGLGLSIVKHAVQYHHGKVELSSEVGRGTTFTVIIPTVRQE